MKKTVTVCLLAVVMVVCLLAGCLAERGSAGNEAVSTESSGRYEGAGFDSPEEAAAAYIEALRAGDLDRMISCFAIESYAEGYDLEARLDRVGALTAVDINSCPLPATTETGTDVNVELRRGQVVAYARTHFMTVSACGTDFWDIYKAAYIDAKPLYLEQEGVGAGELADGFRAALDQEKWKTIDSIKTESPETLSDMYNHENNGKNLEKNAAIYGCEQLSSAVVRFKVDADEFLFMPDAGLYGGKWYLVSPQGNIASLMAALPAYQGLGPAGEIFG